MSFLFMWWLVDIDDGGGGNEYWLQKRKKKKKKKFRYNLPLAIPPDHVSDQLKPAAAKVSESPSKANGLLRPQLYD